MLDEGDNQLAQFLRYLIVAVRTCEPTACSTTLSLLGAAQLPDVDYFADVVVSELSRLTVELVLVLDDYHLIRSGEVHKILRHLLRYMPPQLHLVIISRTDPPLHLGRLRIEQQITELRAADLRFGKAETRQFMDRRLAQSLDEDALKIIQKRTEGWITALQLSSIALQSQDAHQFLDHFHGSNRLLVGYLIEEVMGRLAGPLRDFLLRTAIVDRFCASLADALCADRPLPDTSQAMIAQLEAQNLFVIPLDPSSEWVRYHDLFRDFLLHQLQRAEAPENVARLHRRASAWYAEQRLIEEAVHHAILAGDEDTAVDLFVTHFHAILDQQLPGPTLLRWLALFPTAMKQTRPELLCAQIWLTAFGIGASTPYARLVDVEALVQSDATLTDDRRQALLIDLQVLRGITAYWDCEPQRALTLLQHALDQRPPTHQFARAQTLIHLAGAYHCLGEMATARTLLRTALTQAQMEQRPTLIILLGGLAFLHCHSGELTAMFDVAQQAVTAVDETYGQRAWRGIGFVEIWYAWVHYLRGLACYEQNDLAAAAHHWGCVETMRYRTNPSAFQGSLLGLALIAQANDAPSAALAYAQAAREFVTEINRPNLLAASASFEVRLALLNGQIADADRQTQAIAIAANQGVTIGVEIPILTRLRALLALHTPATLATALSTATACLHHAERVHNTTQVIQICALQGLILQCLGRTAEAFDALARALTLGQPGGFVRTFLDFGAPMADLLRQYGAARGQSPYTNELLGAFPQPHNQAERSALTAQYAKLYGITPLTPRELELLDLIRHRFSIKEIANTLVISPNTVKKHTNNIYSKLGVRNRRQAVAKAEELGLLPPA
ncbi:MAG: LuxR C-terminal-related transcriptional regulator [Caldilineaceae bacterium]